MAPRIQVIGIVAVAMAVAGVWWLRKPAPTVEPASAAQREAVAQHSPFGRSISPDGSHDAKAVSADRAQLDPAPVEDPQQAWERVADAKDPLVRKRLRTDTISTWAAREPRRAYAVVTGLPPGWERSELLEVVTTAVARRDPLLALDLVKSVEADKVAKLNVLVAEEWARHDPSAAARWIESVKSGAQGPLAYAIAGAYVLQKPEEALAWALRIGRSPGRNLWASMLGELANRDPDQALRLAMNGETAAQRANGASSVLGTVASHDQALAMSYIEKLPASMRADIFRGVARDLAAASPAAAFDWLERTDDRRVRVGAIVQMSGEVVYNDVDAAAALVDRVPRELREMWVSRVARAYVDFDVDKAREWVRKYQGDMQRLVPDFARSLARRNPTAALEVANEIADEKDRDRALAQVLAGVAVEEPERAVKWIDRIGSDKQRAQAVSGIASAWTQYDQPAARKWLMSMPDGSARDSGLGAYLQHLDALDEIVEVVGQIRGTEERMNVVMVTAMRLKALDPDASRALLRRYPLDPTRQAQYEGTRSDATYYYGYFAD